MDDDSAREDSGIRLGRRGFLAGLAGVAAGAAGLGGTRSATAAAWLAGHGHDMVPGDVIRVPWPREVDHRLVRAVHTRDGQTLSRDEPAPPTGEPLPVLEIPTRPPRGHLGPGRHDFFLELEGRRFWLGGFDLKTYEFGF